MSFMTLMAACMQLRTISFTRQGHCKGRRLMGLLAPGGCIMQRRAGDVTAGAIVGTLLAYRKDLKQLEFDLASATGK